MTPIANLQRLRQQAPHVTLFVEADRRLDAFELYVRSANLANRLSTKGIGPDSNVALYLPRGLDAVVAIYGVLMAGACYVPLASGYPEDGNMRLVRDAECQTVLVNETPPPWIVKSGIEVIDVTTVGNDSPIYDPDLAYNKECRAAILYTSGSTGTPKGVVVPHRAITAFTNWAVSTFELNHEDRIASLAPFNFDLSLFDLFAAPAVGTTTFFIPDNLKLAPARLVDWFRKHEISTWYTVPSMLGLLALKGGLANRRLPRLERILFAGEVFPTPVLEKLCALLPDTRFFNLFGPTETNVCLYWPVGRARLKGSLPIPVGGPACQAELAIDAEQGELLVKGPCLMSGYWQAGKAAPILDERGWFHTGDRVAVNALGEFEFNGRLDRMIKSAGYRIEPVEIEQILCEAPGVLQAAVVGIPDPLSGTRIAAAVVVERQDHASIRAHASRRLAIWMRPSFYLFLKELPILPNGKTDYSGISRAIEEKLST